MDNQELLENLEKAKHWEDEFILKYDADDFWELLKTLPEGTFEKIRPLFEENISDTRKHKKMIENIIEDIQGGKL